MVNKHRLPNNLPLYNYHTLHYVILKIAHHTGTCLYIANFLPSMKNELYSRQEKIHFFTIHRTTGLRRMWMNCAGLPYGIKGIMESFFIEEYRKTAAEVRGTPHLAKNANFIILQMDQELGRLLLTADAKQTRL